MAPRNKKTTMSKLAREHKLRERRQDKQAKKNARKQAAFEDSVRLDEAPEPNEALATPAVTDSSHVRSG
jgi:hypothetical protein